MSAGLTFVSTSPEFMRLISACESRPLTSWEAEFVGTIRERRNPLTDKQQKILNRIASGGPNYDLIKAAAIRALPEILPRWLPGGTQSGHEYTVRNPKRGDRAPGSFKVNTDSGRWADFADGIKGGDTISLAAWLFDLPQPEAARRVAAMLGLITEVTIG